MTVGTIDMACPVDWQHPDNAGLALLLLGLPGVAGGPRWPDLTARTAGASLVGGATWAPTPGEAVGLLLSGSGQYAAAGYTPAGAGGLTVAVTLRLDAAGSYRTAFAARSSDVDEFSLLVDDTSHLVGGSWGGQATGGPALQTGRRYRAAVTGVPGGVCQLYLNGLPVGTSGTLNYSGGGPLLLGARPGGSLAWPGLLGGLRLWERELSPAEIARDCDRTARGVRADDTLRRLSGAAFLLPGV